jgi:hypothetical protein
MVTSWTTGVRVSAGVVVPFHPNANSGSCSTEFSTHGSLRVKRPKFEATSHLHVMPRIGKLILIVRDVTHSLNERATPVQHTFTLHFVHFFGRK